MYIIILVFLVINFKTYYFLPVENLSDWDVIVETSNGKVRGDLQKSQFLNINYYAFQSIPYAEPPIGDRRFKDPIAMGNWSDILDATAVPKVCPQLSLPVGEMSEDCLVLNIFIPSPRTSDLLPVIFWVHGGFFMMGDGRSTSNPDLFINEGVIVVSINYRLGVFGFLSNEDDVLSGNYGIKDQIMALKWVHNNIASFGGDPSKITLMGQSAGAASIGLLLQTPLTEGLFSAAILQSGNGLNLWSRMKNAKSMARDIANDFNIKYNNSQDLIDGLQKINWADLSVGSILTFYVNAALSNPANGFSLGPTIEMKADGVLNGKLHEKFRTGEFNRVPVLTGYNSGEGNSFIPLYDEASLYLILYDLIPSKLVPADINAKSSLLNAIGKEIKSFYFGSKSIIASKQSLINFISDHEFIRPANEFARLLSNYTDTYFYKFSYVGQLPQVDTTQRELPGVVHAEELQYLFPTANENPATATDLITRQRLVKLWANFAKYHNPTPDVDPLLQNLIWEPVQDNQMNYMDIDENLQILNNPSEAMINFWKNLYDTYGIPPYDTY